MASIDRIHGRERRSESYRSRMYQPTAVENCTTYWLGLEWRIPKTVGNIIQSDVLKFDIGFQAIQQRHLNCKLYGISAVGYDLYGIFPTEGRLELLDASTDTYKNGLAYDPIFDRLYYAQGQGSPDLMYYDFATGKIEDTLVDLSSTTYAATCKGGDYYFILDGRDDLGFQKPVSERACGRNP